MLLYVFIQCHNPALTLQLLGLMGRIVKGCVREVSLAQVSCILMYVYVAPPTPVGAWSMALGRWPWGYGSVLSIIIHAMYCNSYIQCSMYMQDPLEPPIVHVYTCRKDNYIVM